MTYLRTGFRWLLPLLAVAPLAAQTQIGGGTCSSSSLTGGYAMTLTGRQLASSGTFANVLQANGVATFDGQSKVNVTLHADTLTGVAATLNWSGSYTVQANCQGSLSLSTGDTASFNLVVYNQGNDFLITGSDSNYAYSGGGGVQPTNSCTTAKLSGTYSFNSTGYEFSNGAVSGIGDGVGLIQFDGVSAVTVNASVWTAGAVSTTLTLNGTYSVSANCTASATLSDGKGNSYSMSMSLTGASGVAITGFDTTLAQASKLILTGNGHPVYGQPTAAGPPTSGSCSAADLTGSYGFSMTGRAVSPSGLFTGSLQANGTATFDGAGKVTLTLAANSNLQQGQNLTYSGTYSIPSSCYGALAISSPSPISFGLVDWAGGSDFNIVGSDSTDVYSGAGSPRPAACVNASLSGAYGYSGSGFVLTGGTVNATADEAGLLQFDGQGIVTATYTITSNGTSTPLTATGTYAVTNECTGTATMSDSTGKSNSLNFAVTNAAASAFNMLESNGQFIRSGTAHSSFLNPDRSIGNVASYAVDSTPPGSVFALFGIDLATKPASATTTTLPTQLLNTTVTVNGELAPLFYVDQGQIDAQMPWDIPANTVATVIVKNGSSTSNAAAVFIPAAAPGISMYGNNRAVVVNTDGAVNSGSDTASVGDEVVAYFTGGGPVMAAGKLVTGSPAPNGLSPVINSSSATITVNGVQAVVKYIGLTPQSIGLYQANFIVPQVPKGTYSVVITIGGQASNSPVMTIGN